MKNKQHWLIVLVCMVSAVCMMSSVALACSRVLYHGLEDLVITGRTMDWIEDMNTNLWIFPRGMDRDGRLGPYSYEWTSRYGSVVASGYDMSTTDGMNEEGLVANVLWLAESEYPEFDGSKPGMSLAVWAQYVLDSFATVAETVEALAREEFVLLTTDTPGLGALATVHLSVSDVLGDSAIFEYIDGELNIHHDPSYRVMTNSPTYQQQLALNEYWKEIGGDVMLPGTDRAADRFVRGWYYINTIPETADIQEGVAAVFSVIRNISSPFGVASPGEPNVSATIWRTVANHRDRVYFFESTMTPNIFWVELDTVDFSSSAPVRKLNLSPDLFYFGDTSFLFEEAEPFVFLGLE